jgi:hypothetical protein
MEFLVYFSKSPQFNCSITEGADPKLVIIAMVNFFGRSLGAISRTSANSPSVAVPHAAAHQGGTQMAPYKEPAPMTISEQWNRLTSIIQTAASRADDAARCHAAAALQLDLAQYGVTTLIDELSAVMEMPGRRPRATVHVLEVPSPREFGTAIAA